MNTTDLTFQDMIDNLVATGNFNELEAHGAIQFMLQEQPEGPLLQAKQKIWKLAQGK